METIKIIDLFVKIANNEDVPKKIRYKGNPYLFMEKCNNQYYRSNEYDYRDSILLTSIETSLRYNFVNLNDEVEIIKEYKKIEQIDLGDWTEITSKSDMEYEMFKYIFNKNAKIFAKKISELIDEVNELKKDKTKEAE